MTPIDTLWHLMNLLLPAAALAALSAAGAKLLWRRELAPVSWRRLATGAFIAGSLALLAGLVIFGRDGRMASYGGLVAACALMLWWRGFGPGRR